MNSRTNLLSRHAVDKGGTLQQAGDTLGKVLLFTKM